MIGMILTDKATYQVVKSDGVGFYQHDPFMWKIEGNTFVPGIKVHTRAKIIDTAFNDWVFGFEPEQRERFLEEVFLLVEQTNETNAPTFRKWGENLIKNIPLAFDAAKGISPEDRTLMIKVFRSLFTSTGASVVSTQKDILNKHIKKLPRIGND